MNTQRYFAELEDDCGLRADPYETIEFIHQPSMIKSIIIKDNATGREIVLSPKQLRGPFTGGRIGNRCNLFCMYGICEMAPGKLSVDPRNLKFGDSYVFVTNVQEFLNRVDKASEDAGLAVSWNLVEYYNPKKYSGDVGPFHKSSVFEYQREFRIAVHPGSADPIRLNVGSLEDITGPILPLAEINTAVSVTW